MGRAPLRDGALFECAAVRAAWQQYLSGERNLQYPIRTVVMAQAWLAEHRGD